MKRYLRFVLPALLLTAMLSLASCGGSGSTQQEDDGSYRSSGDEQEKLQDGDTQGMNHGSMDMEQMARQMVAPNGEYSDAAFVDAMIPHHEGAVEMAQVALQNTEHEEIRAWRGTS